MRTQGYNKLQTKGFSLIELMIVLVIISLLAGLVVPAFLRRGDEARLQKITADFATIATALSLYRLDNNALPTSEQGVAALRTRTDIAPVPERFKAGGYLADLPVDPWGNEYLYLYPAEVSDKEYDLYTLGADGRRGGDDQDADRYR